MPKEKPKAKPKAKAPIGGGAAETNNAEPVNPAQPREMTREELEELRNQLQKKFH